MKLIKRLSTICIVLSILMQMVVFAAPIPGDAVGHKYEDAISLLFELEIMVGDGVNFNPDKTVTRGEFAQVLMNMFNLDLYSEDYEPAQIFTDVTADNIFAPAIESGVKQGVINGYKDGTFKPDNEVSGNEAVKMMVSALNYKVIAESKGGYPTGYMTVAKDVNILTGLSDVNYAMPMTRAQVAKLAVNTLNAELLQQTQWGSDDATYETVAGETILSKYHGIYRYDGVVTANDVTSILGNSGINEGYIQITKNDKSYNFEAKNIDRNDVVGKYVEIYYTEDVETGILKVVKLTVLDKKSEIVKISISDIDFSRTSSVKIEYWNDKETSDKTVSLAVNTLCSVVLNGASDKSANLKTILESVEHKDGYVTFIDNDNDKKYDVVNIQAYDTYFVGQIYKNDYIITDQLGKYVYSDSEGKYIKTNRTLTIDEDDSDVMATFKMADGTKADFNSIKHNDILSVAMNENGAVKSYDAIICRNTVEGKISEIGSGLNGLFITINEAEYEVNSSFLNYITGGTGNISDIELSIGSTGTFYLDAFGKIAAYDLVKGVTVDNLSFGMITAYADAKNEGRKPLIRIYSGGVLETYNTADKLTIDGVPYAESYMKSVLDEVVRTVGTTYYNEGKVALPVMFKLNSDKEVRYIDTVHFNDGVESKYSLHNVKGTSAPAKYTYISNFESFNYKYLLKNAEVIQIPGRNDTASLSDVTKYSTYASTKLGNDKAYTVQLFNMDPDSYYVDYILLQQSATSGFTSLGENESEIHDKQMFVVKKVTHVVDEEGNDTIKIYGLEEGRGKEFIVNYDYYNEQFYNDMWDMTWFSSIRAQIESKESDERKNNKILPGDIIRYRTNYNGEIAYVRPVYLCDVKAFKCDDQNGLDSGARYRAQDLAVVSSIDGSNILVRYIINKSTGNSKASTVLNVNSEGFLLKDAAGVTIYNEQKKAYCEGSTIGEWNIDAIYDAGKFNIMVCDYTKGEPQISVGSVADLYDTSSQTTPASIIIMQFRSSQPRGMVILKI